MKCDPYRQSSRFLWAFPCSLILLFLLLASAYPTSRSHAETYETLDQSFEFKTGGTVKIDSGLGEVVVEVWAEELVHVTAKKVSPEGRALAQSDVSFFNTKNLLTVKSQPSDSSTRIDLNVYVPRNTNIRINTTSGTVQIRGAISSAMVETKTGNIRMEAPPSQDADLVLTTTNGTIRTALPVEPYGAPNPKALQGKLGAGGNPVILRSTAGNIQLAALDRELDKDVATIPYGPPPSSSSDNSNNSNYNNYGNDDSLFGNSNNRTSRKNDNSQPYSYGGNYGSGNYGNNSGNNSNNSGNNSGNNNSTDIFGGKRNTDGSDTGYDTGTLGVGHRKNKDDVDSQGGIGVRIIPPPSSVRKRSDNNDNSYDRDRQDRNNQPLQKQPPLQRRKQVDPQQDDQRQQSNTDDEIDQNQIYTRPGKKHSNDQTASNNSSKNNSDYPGVDPASLNNKKSPNLNSSTPDRAKPNQNNNINDDNDEGTIKIDTKLVTLNVSVMDRGGKAITNLKSNNFQVYEDGVQQQVSHFESVNSPFNLILLIDLSGSIIDKIDILRRAALRFIEVTKPEDKIAVVAFTRTIQVVCDLTSDRQLLRQRLQFMHMPKGGTAFYEALWFTVDQIVKPVEGERNAIVLLSDGVDNAISVTYPIPSRVSYEQVLRKSQEAGVLIFPIYLDTEAENVSQEIEAPETYVVARKQLAALAEVTGGVQFRAERPENLEGVYEKVAADLRTLYSIAYYPSNSTRDGSWRKLKVKVDKADVAVRTRRGYYAR